MSVECFCDAFIIHHSSFISASPLCPDTVLVQFNKEHGDIHEAKLKVIYSAPAQPPSPVAESAEEGPLGAAEVIEDLRRGRQAHAEHPNPSRSRRDVCTQARG